MRLPGCVAVLVLVSLAACCLSPVGVADGGSDGGGDGGSDSGIPDSGGDPRACVDAGGCTDDSQCPPGDYCDFILVPCPSGAGKARVDAHCLPILPYGSGACRVPEDCPPGLQCLGLGDYPCNPCDGGGGCGITPCLLLDGGHCPAGCYAPPSIPHACSESCICSEAACCGS